MPASALLLAARLASLNLCTDEYLLLLARPQEIASVSYLAADDRESPLWRAARRHHRNRGTIEQVAALRPTLVLTMGGGGRASSLIARRLGIRSLDLPPPSSPTAVAANLRTVAAALGQPKRAEPLVRRLEALQQSAPPRRLDAVWLSSTGTSLAAGSAGAHWLGLAGLSQRPLADGRTSLEPLLSRPPRVLVVSRYRSDQWALGARLLRHPAVRRMPSARLSTDGRAWTCMGPLMIGEIERLRVAAARVR